MYKKVGELCMWISCLSDSCAYIYLMWPFIYFFFCLGLYRYHNMIYVTFKTILYTNCIVWLLNFVSHFERGAEAQGV